MNDLKMNENAYEICSCPMAGDTIVYRAFKNLSYVKHPASPVEQQMNIYVPEAYYHGEKAEEYEAGTAPIYLRIMVGGYMPSTPGAPGANWGSETEPNSVFLALKKGFIVAAPGTRGRTSQNENGMYVGKAPAVAVDLKAAIRYLRYNKEYIPGDTEKIIVCGTSAGGALTALLGVSGNIHDFDEYLEELGAADERDDVFACNCYCPITNLENADAAYEWQFGKQNVYRKGETFFSLNPFELKIEKELKTKFPDYVNNLELCKGQEKITLNEDGGGSLVHILEQILAESARKAVENGTDLSHINWLKMSDGKVIGADWNLYTDAVIRCKPGPAFDRYDLTTPENMLFGDADVSLKHFTQYALQKSTQHGEMADEKAVRMMNAMNYINAKDCTMAGYWRIRHGSLDSDTSLAIPVLLAFALEKQSADVDLAVAWGKGHGGDYDLQEQFQWIKKVTEEA
ncbi:MAG: subtype B tannase [Ruminococcus sp.]